MPWFRIPPDRLTHLPLFGYDLVRDEGSTAWYTGPNGRMQVEKNDPRVWLEDETDAIQLGATAVIITEVDPKSPPSPH